MKRKTIAAAIGMLGLAVMAPASLAGSVDGYLGQVDLTWDPGASGYSNGYGGEFNATLYYSVSSPATVIAQASNVFIPSQDTSGIPTSSDGYALKTTNPAVFETFCIQAGNNDVTYNPGSYYAGVVESDAYNNNGSPPNPNNPQYLTSLTQTLYAEFSDGTLVGYNYDLDTDRDISAGELQAAIWLNQGDYGSYTGLGSLTTSELAGALGEAGFDTSDPTSLTYLGYVSAVEGFLGTTSSDANAANVEILGMYDTADDAIAGGQTGIAQAQLVEVCSVPLPSTGNTMIVLLSAAGLFGLVRRVRKTA